MKLANSRKDIIKIEAKNIKSGLFDCSEFEKRHYNPFFNVDSIDLEGISCRASYFRSDEILRERYCTVLNYYKHKNLYDFYLNTFFNELNRPNQIDLLDVLKKLVILSFDLEAILLLVCLEKLDFDISHLKKYVVKNDDDLTFYKDIKSNALKLVFLYNDNNQKTLYSFLAGKLILAGFHVSIEAFDDSTCLNYNNILVVLSASFATRFFYSKLLFKTFSMFYRSKETFLDYSYCFFAGNYLSFVQFIYKDDFNFTYKQDIKISLVIPVKTINESIFESTLKSCLNQKYDNYEILISINTNNSVDKDRIYKVLSKLNSNKIRCVNTPYPLKLSRSFEYAFLKARGEYIISIGADDALVPSALTKIDRIINDEHCDILMWNLALFFWPSNKGEKPVFEFEPVKNRGTNTIKHLSDSDLLPFLLGKKHYLELPNFYLKTCFKRDIIFEMMSNTGKAFDGISQDIYTGVYNILSHKKVECLNDILVIAGTSSNSFGKQYDRGDNIDAILDKSVSYLMNYRYKNIFPFEQAFFDYPYGFGNESVCITDYLKLTYLLCTRRIISERQLLDVICRLYVKLPIKICDKGILTNTIKKEIIKRGSHFVFFRCLMKRFARIVALKTPLIRVLFHKIKKRKSEKVVLFLESTEDINSTLFVYNN